MLTRSDPAPAEWVELIRRIRKRTRDPVSTALDNPLALTLVRDTYQVGDSISELIEFCDTLDGMPVGRAAEAITDHLLTVSCLPHTPPCPDSRRATTWQPRSGPSQELQPR